jgi:hypothetical protein
VGPENIVRKKMFRLSGSAIKAIHDKLGRRLKNLQRQFGSGDAKDMITAMKIDSARGTVFDVVLHNVTKDDLLEIKAYVGRDGLYETVIVEQEGDKNE